MTAKTKTIGWRIVELDNKLQLCFLVDDGENLRIAFLLGGGTNVSEDTLGRIVVALNSANVYPAP